MKNIKCVIIYLFTVLFVISCDEDTGNLGIISEDDGITNSSAVFNVYSRSIAMDSIIANSTTSFLGDIIDPETNSRIQACFAAQFHTFENYAFPDKKNMFPIDPTLTIQPSHTNDSVFCDSIELRLYFDKYYGDGSNPMKLEILPLDKKNIIQEDRTYYSNLDLKQFVDTNAKTLATKMFSPEDFSITDAERNSSKHSDNIRITLPKEYGTQILQDYYAHPEYFKSSYSFIRNVCPGFYFHCISGSGTMLGINVSTINLYFTYYDSTQPDSIYQGVARFAATPEVIQSTQISNRNLEHLLNDDNCTYIKTPAGICTELTIPIDEIYEQHQTDSVSKAQLTLTRFNKQQENYLFGTPSTLLLVKEDDMYSFFEQRKVTNTKTSYTATFNESNNSYSFENICRFISSCKRDKLDGMAAERLSEDEWEAKHPNWNKVVLIPVKVSNSTDSFGTSNQSSVTHDIGMNSIRLVGGTKNAIQMQVIYSRFK